jgi:hypothetical protein
MEDVIDEEEMWWEMESAMDWGEDDLARFRRLGAQDWRVQGLCWFKVGPVHWGGADVPLAHDQAVAKQLPSLMVDAAATQEAAMEETIVEDKLRWELEIAVDWGEDALPCFLRLGIQDWGCGACAGSRSG